MKKFLSMLVVIVVLCGLFIVPASAAGNGSLSMGSAGGNQGDTVTLNVNLNSNPGLVTMTIRVSYDPAVLKLTNVSNSGLLVGAQLNTGYGSPYTISWVDGATTANNTKTGTIAAFTFKILDHAKLGDSAVTLQFVDSYDTDYQENSFSVSSGKVTVNCKHSYDAWARVDDASHGKSCSACQNVQKEAHKWDNGTTVKQANCKDGGQIKYTCTTCAATKTVATAKTNDHKFGSWIKINDTTHKRTCSACAKEESASHSWNGGKVTKQPTCKAEGVKTDTCAVCNATKTEKIAKLTIHTYDHACDTDCDVCGAARTVTHNYQAIWSKDKTGHWQECSLCKEKKDVKPHTPGEEATATTAQLCTICGYEIAPALGVEEPIKPAETVKPTEPVKSTEPPASTKPAETTAVITPETEPAPTASEEQKPSDDKGFPFWSVILVVIGGIAVFWVIKRESKERGKT